MSYTYIEHCTTVKCPFCKSKIKVKPDDLFIVKDIDPDEPSWEEYHKAFKCPACNQIIYRGLLKWKVWYVDEGEINECQKV